MKRVVIHTMGCVNVLSCPKNLGIRIFLPFTRLDHERAVDRHCWPVICLMRLLGKAVVTVMVNEGFKDQIRSG